jgi:hypothetical protein
MCGDVWDRNYRCNWRLVDLKYDNVKLWFARDSDDNIVTINETKSNKRYTCPLCGSNVKPKALKSKQITSHFAHVDASKCNPESMIHWWFKNKFIVPGDKFSVKSDCVKDYICKEVIVEQSYEVNGQTYKPDEFNNARVYGKAIGDIYIINDAIYLNKCSEDKNIECLNGKDIEKICDFGEDFEKLNTTLRLHISKMIRDYRYGRQEDNIG